MAPRVDGTNNNNQELFTPVDSRVEQPTVEQPPLDLTDRNLLFRQNNLSGDTRRIDLLAQFNRTGDVAALRQTPPAVNQNKVQEAIESIQGRLEQSITDWDVTRGDLTAIQGTFRSLNTPETNAVFRGLSDGNLQTFADELDGLNGGFNAQEKKTLFNELAAKLDGQQLARFTNALGDADNIRSLADSVANRASDATTVDLINRMRGAVSRNEGLAVAVAELTGGLSDNPRALEGVLQSLSRDGQLATIIKAATQEEVHTVASPGGGGSVYTTHDPAPLVDMLNAVSRTGNAELKAEVFQTAALELKRVEESGGVFNPVVGQKGDAKQIRDALTRVLSSDPGGIVRRFEITNTGSGITAYLKSSINNGETANVRGLINQLSTGGNRATAQNYLEQNFGTANRPIYMNARSLGFFAGCLYSSINQISSDARKQGDTIKNIFGAVSGAAGAFGPQAGVAGALANGLANEAVGRIVDGVANRNKDLRQALFELMLPPEPRDIPQRGVRAGDPYTGNAKDIYNSSFGAAAALFGFDG